MQIKTNSITGISKFFPLLVSLSFYLNTLIHTLYTHFLIDDEN